MSLPRGSHSWHTPGDTLLTMAFPLQATVAGCLLLTLSAALHAHAAELVTLRNGFTLNCSSRETVSPDVVRLHLDAGTTGQQNYMDVPLASIAAIEAAADVALPSAAPVVLPGAESADLITLAQRSGETHHLNAALLMAVIRAESAGNARAVSRTGARGLMQLMPGTATRMGVVDSFSPEANVNGGSAYLDGLLLRYHDNVTLALAAYNAGPAAVDRYHGVPPYRETQIYVAKVIRVWNSLVETGRASLSPDRVTRR